MPKFTGDSFSYKVDETFVPLSQEALRDTGYVGILSQEEINEILSILDGDYQTGSLWEHKEGGVYEIVQIVESSITIPINVTTTVKRAIELVWYKPRFDSKIDGNLYVRTKEHFESSFTFISEYNLISSDTEGD